MRMVWRLIPAMLLPALAMAECNYQLISADLRNCKVIPNTDVVDQDPTEDALPDENEAAFVTRVRCTCRETLRGSNPACDFDRDRDIVFYIPHAQIQRCTLSPSSLCREHCNRQT